MLLVLLMRKPLTLNHYPRNKIMASTYSFNEKIAQILSKKGKGRSKAHTEWELLAIHGRRS